MSNDFKNKLKKENFESQMEELRWFSDEELAILRKKNKIHVGYSSEIGDDMGTTISAQIPGRVSNDMSYLLSYEEREKIFQKVFGDAVKKSKTDEGGRE